MNDTQILAPPGADSKADLAPSGSASAADGLRPSCARSGAPVGLPRGEIGAGGRVGPSPASAAAGGGPPGPPILDKKCGNLPFPLGMQRKHYLHRSAIRDFMRFWTRESHVLWWCTLSSSPSSPVGRLRDDFQAWRKRLARSISLDPSLLRYKMVDTREGFGVLHFILAIPKGYGMGRFQIDYSVAGEWWQEIHGARQVKFLQVKRGESSVRRLSQYLVSQYMALGQGDALVRISGSRWISPVVRWRRELLGIATRRTWAYDLIHRMGLKPGEDFGEVWRYVRGLQWKEFRAAWDCLLERGWCEVWGDRWMVDYDGTLTAV